MLSSPAQRTFRDNLTWRAAAGLLFLPLLSWGIYDYADSGKFDKLLWEAVVLAGALFGFALVWAMRRRITIHQEGMSYVSLFRDVDLIWGEITATRYQQQSVEIHVRSDLARSDLSGLLLYVLADRVNLTRPSLWITGRQTVRISTSIRDGHEAIGLVLEKVGPRLRQEAERFLASGASAGFGNISLSPQGVTWKKRDPILWSEIAECRLDGRRLRIITKESKWLGNISIQSRRVPNLFVLMELIKSRMSAPVESTAAESFPARNA